MKPGLNGKRVKFYIISKDSKGNDKCTKHVGRISAPNKSRTGFVIIGESIPGKYNRCLSDIIIFESEPEVSAAQVIDCTQRPMAVMA